MMAPRRRAGALASFGLALGCYSGVSGSATGGPGEGSETVGNDDAGSSDDGGTDDGEPSACDEPAVGVSPLRRLTRSQYNNTIRDLLGIEGDPAATIAPDEKVGAFFSNSTASVTELLAEQYMRVAEDLAETAIADLDALLPCDPAVDDQAACGAEFVDTFGKRAFRRPLTNAEREAMVGLFEKGRAEVDFSEGVRLVILAALQSPQFLYHLELDLPDAEGGDVIALDGWQVASRLSYFVWDSMPDDELLRAADAGALDDPDMLRVQAERMLDDPRAADAIASFHVQWLHIDALSLLEKNPEAYPTFDTALRDAMGQETARFADWVIRFDDGRLETLLTAPYSFLEGPLFSLYGVTQPADHDPTMPVALDPMQRAGLLTQPGVLAVHAHADQSSPVHRGKIVRENILCTPLAPPPPEVDVVPPPLDPNATTRERFDQHRTDPSCAGCHNLIDPIGFGFEHYDGIGAWRATDAGKPVDASGELIGTEDIDGPFDGAPELARVLAGSEQVRTCVAEQWFGFAFGRSPAEDDGCSFDAMSLAFAESDYDVRELLIAIVTTDAFRHRRIEGGGS